MLQYVEHQFFNGVGVFGVGAFQTADEGRFAGGGVEPAQRRRRRAEFGGFQRVAQRRTAVVQQHIAQQPRPQRRQRIGDRPQQPAQHDVSLVAQIFAVVQRIVNQIGDRRGIALFGGNRQIQWQRLEPAQGLRLEAFLMLGGGNVAVGQENGVRGMVVAGVEGLELGVGQIGNGLGIAAAVVVIGGGRKQPALQRMAQPLSRRTQRALHLVEHDALEHQFRTGIVGLGEFQPVAFLGEVAFVQQREERRVEIDIQQVVEILFVLAGERVGGPVAAGEGVHEGVERTPDHHEERIAHRVTLAAAQRGVFEDVGHAGRVLGHGQEGDHEGVVRIVGGEMEMPGAGGAVTVFLEFQPQGGDGVTAQVLERRDGS